MSISSSSKRSFWTVALREPLLHFLLLGGLVFVVDDLLRSPEDDARVIVVGPEVEQEARSIFRGARGREPTAPELQVLRQRWIDNEVLYREGLALQLDRGDPTLRERVIFKALNMINSNLQVPPIDEPGLRDWFERHRTEYDTPARYDFAEAVLVGDTSEQAARRFAEALQTGAPADVTSGLRIFKGRPEGNVRDSFGPEFAEALARLPLEQWQVLPSKEGPRVVRCESRQPAQSVSFESIRARVQQDWEDAKAQELRSAAVHELHEKYTVRAGESSS